MTQACVQALPALVIALAIIVATWALARMMARIVRRITAHAQLRDDLQQLSATLVRLLVWICGVLIAFTVAIPSFTPAGAFASLGVGALAIGFAFQDIFENFLAGVLIMLRDKMNIGDAVTCSGISGKVEKITLRETHVRQFSGEPGVSYDTDLAHAQQVIEQALLTVDAIDKDKGTVVFAQEFNASSVDFLVQWWSDSAAQDLRLTKSQVIFAIKQALDDAGIEIPFPYVTHTFKEAVSFQPAAA
ncbi:MAG: mechanosensitive ion channel [Novosphingobium sp.]